jgi:hypothetical protein
MLFINEKEAENVFTCYENHTYKLYSEVKEFLHQTGQHKDMYIGVKVKGKVVPVLN